MFLRDEVAVSYVAGAILLTFPWLGIVWGTWGFFWSVFVLIAVFLIGFRKGLLIASVLSVIGYVVPLIVFGSTPLSQMSFVPLAGLLGVYGWKRWPVQVTFFWSSVIAAILGVIPTLLFAGQGIDAKSVTEIINSMVQQYKASGLLSAMQQQGISEVQLRQLMQEGIQFYVMILPTFAVLQALLEYAFVFYFFRRWLNPQGRIPFARWKLPWYAVWGAVLGIAFYLLGDQYSWAALRGLGINLMVIYGAVTLILGISVYSYLLRSPKIPRFLKWILILASVIYFYFSVLTIILFGLFDLVFNFRRLPEES
ncbi:putative membrane protein (DUF2232) [Desulfosporosinus acidiphilus SJ4]|uniref:Putative membrane protein (DUF2232) n=1 Tax=Desulfosporosinus acidiphilus (strain DSM 22704 / JCM 16185 / SJ4) TaxID=646529 RepID=I4DCJ6_DESAJ|nr:DUF2232 domain-containing protein [Desulfosporosinus acidiphilus]AFM43520.1 putative membrane protein (DUF2232) [Desulfosporosinus acidiphilus SJ4]